MKYKVSFLEYPQMGLRKLDKVPNSCFDNDIFDRCLLICSVQDLSAGNDCIVLKYELSSALRLTVHIEPAPTFLSIFAYWLFIVKGLKCWDNTGAGSPITRLEVTTPCLCAKLLVYPCDHIHEKLALNARLCRLFLILHWESICILQEEGYCLIQEKRKKR